ncbi:MAG: hypothetical protein N2036_07425 [Bryobacteraceae bacterium]|nr:hypothetical protein [Bryobacteraceae bacterium]
MTRWKWRAVLWLVWAAPCAWAQTTVASLTVSPSSFLFTAADPATSPAPISTTVSWRLANSWFTRTWTLRVQAAPASVANCPRVPVSAFRVGCDSLTLPVLATGNCVPAPVTLSGTPQLLASGNQGVLTQNYQANLRVLFTDSWRYPGALSPSCSVNLVFILEAQ